MPVGARIPEHHPSYSHRLGGGGVFNGNANREVITLPFLNILAFLQVGLWNFRHQRWRML